MEPLPNIRLVRVYGEKVSADEDGARKFVTDFKTFMEDEEINPENVYNMDECGLLWKALPLKALVSTSKKCVSGYKTKKERLKIGLCVNSTGTHKLVPFLIYKYKQPRALKNYINRLPVVFRAETNAWMTQNLFIDCLDNCFKKDVKQYQLQNKISGKQLTIVQAIDYQKITCKMTIL